MKETIAVIYTVMQGRKSYVARTERSRIPGIPGIRITRFTTDVAQAKDFDNEVEAEALIPQFINPSGRQFTAGTETINVNPKNQKAMEEAPR